MTDKQVMQQALDALEALADAKWINDEQAIIDMGVASKARAAADLIKANRAQPVQPAIGMVTVPREPTQAMLDTGASELDDTSEIYRAMIEAAQPVQPAVSDFDFRESVGLMLAAVGYTEDYARQWPKEKVSITFKRWFNEQIENAKNAQPVQPAPVAQAKPSNADSRDAERYRWLLDCGTTNLWIQCGRMDSYDTVEAFIDAAITDQKATLQLVKDATP